MTVIVGVESSEGVWIGADSAGVSGNSISPRADKKVFTKQGDKFIYGCTSSFRMRDILQYVFKEPGHDRGMSPDKYIRTVWIDALMKCYKAKEYGAVKDSERSGGTFLMGYRKKLYYISDDFQVGRSIDRFDSVGSGYKWAIGALNAVRMSVANKSLKGIERWQWVKVALETSEKYCSDVCKPFHILCDAGK